MTDAARIAILEAMLAAAEDRASTWETIAHAAYQESVETWEMIAREDAERIRAEAATAGGNDLAGRPGVRIVDGEPRYSAEWL